MKLPQFHKAKSFWPKICWSSGIGTFWHLEILTQEPFGTDFLALKHFSKWIFPQNGHFSAVTHFGTCAKISALYVADISQSAEIFLYQNILMPKILRAETSTAIEYLYPKSLHTCSCDEIRAEMSLTKSNVA